MLAKFTFKNHRSFLDEQTLSFEASSDDSYKWTVAPVESAILPRSSGLLRTLAVFGPLASGKSNVLRALDYMKRVVLMSASLPITHQNDTFAFQYGAGNLDSHYEVEIIQNGTYYRYGFVIRDSRIVKEWLMRRAERLTTLFSRDEYSLKIIGLPRNSASLLSPSPYTLFLPVASSLNLEINREVGDVMDWFRSLCVSFSARREDLQIYAEKEEYLKDAYRILSLADCGIDGIQLIHEGSYTDIETSHRVYDAEGHFVRAKKARLFQDRQLYSDATAELVCTLAKVLRALDCGTVLCLDDFTRTLGLPVALEIIRLFSNPAQPAAKAQLVLTSGISPLVDKAFRRDQIYFTRRDGQSRSQLVRLSSLPGVRKGESYEKKLLENLRHGQLKLE